MGCSALQLLLLFYVSVLLCLVLGSNQETPVLGKGPTYHSTTPQTSACVLDVLGGQLKPDLGALHLPCFTVPLSCFYLLLSPCLSTGLLPPPLLLPCPHTGVSRRQMKAQQKS